jgi:hypothetical protein
VGGWLAEGNQWKVERRIALAGRQQWVLIFVLRLFSKKMSLFAIFSSLFCFFSFSRFSLNFHGFFPLFLHFPNLQVWGRMAVVVVRHRILHLPVSVFMFVRI